MAENSSSASDPKPPVEGPPTPVDSARASMYAGRRWDLPSVRRARDLLDAGHFCEAARLRSYLRTDPRMMNAEEQLTQTMLGFEREIEGGPSRHGNSPMESMRREAKYFFGCHGVTARQEILQEIVEDLRGFSYKPCWFHLVPSADGTRWDPVLTPWPLEAVELDTQTGAGRRYLAIIEGGVKIPIDGENWIEFRATYRSPHQRGAVRAVCDPWVTRQYAIQDWAVRSGSVAEAKRIGELPEGVSVSSPEGKQFANDLAGLTRARSGMVHRRGGKVTQLDADANGHKVFLDLEKLTSSDYSIAYNGQDGTSSLGDKGTYGARQVLYGVAYDVIRGLSGGLASGVNEAIRRWAFYNFGRVEHPVLEIEVPDLEAEQARALAVDRRPKLIEELKTLSSRGELTPDLVMKIADDYGVSVSEEWAKLWTLPAPAPPAFGASVQQSA